MAKAKVKVGLKGRSLSQKADLGDRVVANSTGKASLPGVQAHLAVIGAKVAAARTKLTAQGNAQQVAQTATSAAHDAEIELDEALTKGGTLVDLDANGSETIVLESGYEVAGTPTPAGPMPKVTNFSATPSDTEGGADMHWNPVDNNHGYVIQRSTDPNNAASWQQVANTSKSQTTVTGLVSGTKYWFRVAALGTGGTPGPFSDPANAIAS